MPSSLRRCSSSAEPSRASFVPEAPLPLAHAALAVLELRVAPVELVEPAAELLLLLRDAALQLLHLLLAGAALLIELGARLERDLLGLELGAADLRLGVAGLGLRLAHLGLGVRARLIDLPLGVVEDALGAASARRRACGRDGVGSNVPRDIRAKRARRATSGTTTISQVMAFIDHLHPGS